MTQSTFWCIVLAGEGWRRQLALAGLIVRLIAAACSMRALGESWLGKIAAVPFRDLFGFAVWVAGSGGREVEWRGLRFSLARDGRITPVRP